ncbi:PKD domain-containing protein [Chitinophaga sp. 30R24]|uniref:PKD domain-containing protein n=1 Tax=Chitinophaga sp. 30R24 TaxID=3248838 RepID=UPI003B91B44C
MSVLYSSQPLQAQQKADFKSSVVSDCETLITTFTDQSTGNPVSWQWDFGNGNTSNKQNPGATYVKTGSYTVTLKVGYANGSTQTVVKNDYIHVRSKPIVDFSISPNAGCMPLTTVFTDKSNPVEGNLQQFSWDFGDGQVALNGHSTTTHTYNQSGVYGVVLTVTNSYGCTNFKVIDKAVTITPPLTADFSVADKVLCEVPANVNFTNLSTGSGTLSYQWAFDDGSTSTDKDPGRHTFANKGKHSITLTVSNELGCKSVKKIDDINVANYSTNLTVPNLVCANTSATYQAVYSLVSPQTVTWEFNDLGIWYGSQSNVSYTAPAAGPLKVKLTATYGNCKDVVEKTINVKASPTAQISTDNQAICAVPATVQFKDNSNGATKWSWTFGDNQSSTVQAPTHVYTRTGSYYVTLTATNQEGCSVSSGTLVDIRQTQIQAYASNIEGCIGTTASFYANSNSNDPIKTWLWTFGDGSTSTEANPKHTYTSTGFYKATLQYTTANGCSGTAAVTDQIKIYQQPTPDFTSPQAPIICGNSAVTFVNQSNIGNNWYWTFGDGTGDYYGNNTTAHSYSEPGTYDISLTVWNGSCSNTITKKAYIQTVNPFPRFEVVKQPDCNNRLTVSVNEHSLGATSWTWSWGDGQDTTYTVQSSIVKHTYAKSGTYTIKLTTSDGHCTTWLSNTATVIAKAPLILTTDITDLCSSESLIAKITAPNTGIYDTYGKLWYMDNQRVNLGDASSAVSTYTHLPPGHPKIYAVWINNVGCYDTSNVVQLNVRGPIADYTLPAAVQCRGGETVFTDNSDLTYSKGIVKWEWTFGDGTAQTYTAGPFKHSYQKAGYYYPSLKVTDKEGCTNAIQGRSVRVNGPIANFSPENTLVKPGSTVLFYNYSDEVGGRIVDTRWDFGDGKTVSQNGNATHNYPDKGTYNITLHLTDDNGCTDEMSKKIKVSAVGAAFTYSSSFVNNSNCAPMLFRFTNTSLNYSVSSWDFGDGSTSDQTHPVHTYTESGHYKVTLKVKGDAGTEDEYNDSVIVKGPYATIKNTPDGGCLEQEITFSIAPENATTFSWDFADGNVLPTNDLEVKHHYAAPGIYKPRLLLKDDAGCKGSAFLDHPIVIDQLDIKLNATPAQICDEGPLTFAPVFNSFSIDELQMTPTFSWSYNPSLTPTDITTTQPGFYLDKQGEYPFSLSVTTAYGCTQTATLPIHVYPKPVASISGPAQVCQEVPVTFNGSVTKSTDVTWNWDFGNGNTSQQQQPTAQLFRQPGDYTIALHVTSKDGCSNETSHPIRILPLPDIQASAPSDFICLNNTIPLHAGGGDFYEWTPVDGLSNPAIANPLATPITSTTYQVKVTDNNGCINTDAISLRVVQPLKIQATPDTVLCLGDKLSLRAWGADIYAWQGADLDLPASATPATRPKTTGTYVYEVTGYDKEGCFSDKTSVTTTVNPSPKVEAGPDREIMAGVPLYLSATASSDVVRWRWSPADYLNCADCARVQVLPNLTTTYLVQVENTFGCKAYDNITVHILCHQSAIYIPNAFTPNRDGQNERIYPKGKGVREIEWLRIYDRWGKLVFENTHFPVNQPNDGWNGRIKNEDAPFGTYIYFMQTVCESGEQFTFKGTITLLK